MSSSPTPICTQCGARLAAGADVCDLCGTSASLGAASIQRSPEPPTPEPEQPGAASPEAGPSAGPSAGPPPAAVPFCHRCGWQSPPEARFCARCGTALQDLSAAPPLPPPAAPARPPARPASPAASPAASAEASDSEPAKLGRQMTILFGAGLLLVVTLFFMTVVSKQQSAPPQAGPVAEAGASVEDHASVPLPDDIAAQAERIEAEAEALTGAERAARLSELVNLFVGIGRPDRAALAQEKVAAAMPTADAWTRAGNLFYDWMNTLEGGHQRDVAQRAVDAYGRSLELEPDNYDVRTDMATALMMTNNPMEGVTQIRRVLDAVPDHVQANYNYGLMLMWINRLDQAIDQFEKVKALTGAESPFYQQAESRIQAIEAQGAAPGS